MSNLKKEQEKVVIIGAGFTGLSIAYELARNGIASVIIEKDDEIGGLGGSFNIGRERLEKFYHHWFNNDYHALQLAKELNCDSELLYSPARTGIYLNGSFYKMSNPVDVLRFKPLSMLNRIRLGLLVLKARRIKDFRQLESVTAEKWLLKQCGKQVYRVVWEPLLRGKFGPFASQISAVWFWNKVVLRGSSRSKFGNEELVYYKGGWAAFADRIAEKIIAAGGKILTQTRAKSLTVKDSTVTGVKISDEGSIKANIVIATPALPIIADLVDSLVSKEYLNQLRAIKYLANVCLVLELSQSLSDIYWLNVNDPDFPFVGIIEHTNFQPDQTCSNRHIVYLSKYFPESAELYRMSKEQVFEFSLPYIKSMFPKFEKSWVHKYHVYKARYAQPVVVRHYSQLIPSNQTPIEGLYIATMAQIYPEDRGTNYAIREGRRLGQMLAKRILDTLPVESV